MSCQQNPETYAIVIRCNLKDGAILKTMAADAGVSVSTFIGEKVHDLVEKRDLTEVEQMWYDAHLEVANERRRKADEKNKKGYYKRKHPGRPRKPGPRKGSHRVKTVFVAPTANPAIPAAQTPATGNDKI